MSWSETPSELETKRAAEAAPAAKTGEARGEVLVVNRDPETRIFLHKALFVGRFGSTCASGRPEVEACLRQGSYAAAIACVESPESIDVIEAIRRARPELPLLAFARAATPELVRDVMRFGVDDFVFGTFNGRSLIRRLEEIVERPATAAKGVERPTGTAAAPRKASGSAQTPAAREGRENRASVDIICENPKTLRVLEIAGKIAPTDSTVLVAGESGTGKEIIARWIHEHSRRAEGAFVEVNCGALPQNLLESQLFGHEKGSFTGAVHRQLGIFEIADGGTIFLDEIGEMGLDMQVKLLRVLQSREFRRIGGSQVVKVDVRVLAATNRDLKEEVEQGRFRADLYYRLNVISLCLPPLRERRDEIPKLIAYFSERMATERGLPRRQFSREAVASLQRFSWAGNIRELENTVERLILLSRGDVVDEKDIEENLEQKDLAVTESPFAADLTLDEVKRIHIARVLKENDGNKMKSARILKINVKTLYNLIRNLEISY